MQPLKFDKKYSRWFAKPVLRAIRNYGMISDGEKIAVALSGGKDSMTLLYILAWLQKYSHLNFDLCAIHVKAFAEVADLEPYCKTLGIEYFVEKIEIPQKFSTKSICSACARLKRGAMTKFCRNYGIRTLAFGHHATDAAETLLMNMLINKKLGSFCPLVSIEDSPVKLIRPMIYLQETEILSLQKHFGIEIPAKTCLYESHNLRQIYKKSLANLIAGTGVRNAALHMVEALENPDASNVYTKLTK